MKLTRTVMERYCDVVIWALGTARKARYRKGDVVLVSYHLDALRMAELLYARLLHMGLHPVLRLRSTPRVERVFYGEADAGQLVFVPAGERELYETLNGAIYLLSPESLTHLSDVDPGRIGKAAVAAKPLRDILDRREAKGLFGWTLCLVPTPELARHARLSFEEYTGEVVRACYLDRRDPVQTWKEIQKEATAIREWLTRLKARTLHIESRNVDLKIAPGERRKWVGVSGHNIPSFEIFLSPDWRGTEGVYFADQPSYRNGNYVKGVRLVFRKGRVKEVRAQQGEEFTVKQLSMDKGAGRVGEFSLTDKRFSRIGRFMANTLYDENFGGRHGNCHVAVGSSYSDTFAGNPSKLDREAKKALGFNESALHWDLVNTEEKVVTAHLPSGARKVIYEKGMFQY
ncbi:MAG: aminopeptidase [Deltaproteobacteria bacterium]|nr:aminopeptidase [Deltaproteobacteria bacterium]